MRTQNPLEYTSIKNKMQMLKRENICDIDDRELSLKDLIMNVEEVEQSDNVGQRR
jgi:cytidylate kinase